jgi:signal transduction histidine kinase/iron only hydrogenase large subunit-like protein
MIQLPWPNEPLVRTIKERCRTCYTCVRECPAKAIRISSGQAEVIQERCIGCGNCVRVCSQNAKQVRNCVDRVQQVLDSRHRVAACLAPSFPAEFPGVDYRAVVGMIRALGFDLVTEVAFGADLVAAQYRRLLTEQPDRRHIATSCPAIVSLVEKYHPALVKYLSPIVSPMVAQARVLHQLHGPDLRVVFIGPCIAKKAEAQRPEMKRELAGVLTFQELRAMLARRHLTPEGVTPADFDPPHASKGMLFPIGGGMLEAADLREDLLTNQIVATSGARTFLQAIREFEEGALDAVMLEVLCCNGCIMGSGMTTTAPLFTRRTQVSRYARQRLERFDPAEWRQLTEKLEYLNLGTAFTVDDHRLPMPSADELKNILARMGKTRPEDELNCGACGYDTCVEHAIAIHKGLAENEMCLPFVIENWKESARQLSNSYEMLVNTKNALMQSEKLASMGQLAAGIAHEVNNPLAVILLYANLLLDEATAESPLREDLRMIAEQAERAKHIVGGLLNFARKNKVVLQETNINELIDRSLKALIIPAHIRIRTEHHRPGIVAAIDSEQIIQVLANLVTNAIEAMPDVGLLLIITDETEECALITVKDTGTGIEPEHMKKIFEPFFTTKQMGKGIGLGLAVSYGIIKMHRGQIWAESNCDPAQGPVGTTFYVKLPKKRPDTQDLNLDSFPEVSHV